MIASGILEVYLTLIPKKRRGYGFREFRKVGFLVVSTRGLFSNGKCNSSSGKFVVVSRRSLSCTRKNKAKVNMK